MADTDQNFAAAIAAHPLDLALRHVYADWLDEQGDALKAALMRELRREVRFAPAYDRRHPDPEQNYGIHGVECQFVVSGPAGAVRFVVFTGWMLPGNRGGVTHHGMGSDLSYHGLRPPSAGQAVADDSCPLLDGRPCYADGSTLAAQRLFDDFVAHGDGFVWAELESRYRVMENEQRDVQEQPR